MKNVLSKPVIIIYSRVNDPAKLRYGVILTNFLKDYRKHSNYFAELASKKIKQKIQKSKGNKQS